MAGNKRLERWNGFLNNSNDTTANGLYEPITGQAAYGGGLDLGDYFDITDDEGAKYSAGTTLAPGTQTLMGGRYQRVKVDSGATATNLIVGRIAAHLAGLASYIVTTYDLASPTDRLMGVFLNSPTPGNYTFIQVLGKMSVVGASSFAATAAIGDLVTVTTNGYVTDPTQSGNITYAILPTIVGLALTLPVLNSIFIVKSLLVFEAY